MKPRVIIGYHGHCFDGMSSAGLLTRFFREHQLGDVDMAYRGLDHQPGGSHVPDDLFQGDVHAVVDFRYSLSPKLDWWFDHHLTGLVGEAEEKHYTASDKSQKFFDPGYGSCCKLIADTCRVKFGWSAPELSELVRWADIIDTAGFENAETAVELKAPALQLMSVIEVHGHDGFLAPRIERLSRGESIESLAGDTEVQTLLKPILEVNEMSREAIEQCAKEKNGVVSFDISHLKSDRYNKFIPYWLFPDSQYCVAVSVGKDRAKVSVGSNPWSPVPRTHNISAICAQYGGGGHAVVGAVSFKPLEIARARQVAAEIVETLETPGTVAPQAV
ncbi:MAG: phosphoesterase [Myxococcales bacterium]|nr:phosphoesterase [Myxococcales bacterium]MCB9709187.1 phosphoesterase [Myxococcales bacterium]